MTPLDGTILSRIYFLNFANYIVEFGYGELYDRKALTDKPMELLAVADLIGQGNTGMPLKTNISVTLNVG